MFYFYERAGVFLKMIWLACRDTDTHEHPKIAVYDDIHNIARPDEVIIKLSRGDKYFKKRENKGEEK